ncbi:putative F-box/LRR-repeat protein At3g44090 isoform X3 [Lycium ferocissimum]|uniref:putative F-box/LRR-repeat protein At3g44090 isoform X3 n=1 Tax=Lycium ferocissimum TaxID=112874 RepID=UPI0028149B41|nr:putative F-box/LRR-repeat protein At3g44090 isoform X3 [Lycium ferocissimum]
MILKLDVTNLKDITNKKGLVDSMMAPKKGRKHSCQTLPPDLLSNLPKNALDGILVRLPLREAVRTSILSKKWRYTWCKLPELTLDETLWETPADAGSLRWGRDLTFVTSNFTKIMYHILTLHAGPITKFTLSISMLLVLEINHVMKVIEINAPMLRSFDFTGSVRFLCLKNIPLLEKFSLADSEYVDRKESHDIVKFFRSLSTIEHLHLEYMWFSACLGLDIPARLPFNLNRVKHFSLRFSLICLDEVLCTLCLIRSFPYLQYLKIEIVGNHDEDIPALECLEVEHFSDVTFNHLREVRLIMGTGSKPEMQLIKLLLAKSPLLVRMLIEAGMFEEFVPARIQESAAVQMLVKVAKFQRASPTAEVDLRLF